MAAEVEVPKTGAQGVIIVQRGLDRRAGKPFRPARTSCAWNSSTMGGLAQGGLVSMYVDGTKDGEGRVDTTAPMIFSCDETCDVGKDAGSPVSPDYGPKGNEFNGEVSWIQIDLEKDDHDHLIGPQERFTLAMGRQ